MAKNPAEIGLWRAIWKAFWWRPTDFYPRIKDNREGPIRTLPTTEIIAEFAGEAADWNSIPDDEGTSKKLETAIGLARQSLNEVKSQTEYQDAKAGRLLTVATILSALSGLLFSRFNDTYPVQSEIGGAGLGKWLVLATYLPFIAFVLAALFGALVTFHATRTRFKYPVEEEAAANQGSAHSRLFYNPILGVRPRVWAQAFVTTKVEGDQKIAALNPKLPQLYFRDLIGETYLVAAKTADKIRYLEEAQSLFAFALRCLLIWLVMLAAVSLFVAPPRSEPKPTKVEIVGSSAPAGPAAVTLVQKQPIDVAATIKPQSDGGGRNAAQERSKAHQ